MNSFETLTVEEASPDIDPRRQAILDGPPSSNYNYRQMQLIAEKFLTEHPGEKLDHDTLQRIGLEWAGSDYSKAFKLLRYHDGFNTHTRFQGDISKITLEDVEYVMANMANKKLPEN